ncbi:hypothetical protein C3469_21595 [Mycobacterium kansasii]|nr:hypothetical protein C3470_25835 [Mycobacterium kansasii]POY07263.1 hypothetical protein C3477_07955 [Mycobacterium kansasii]POY13638.1 hypothetical protein C3472_23310 [Mycobacterium kansasii]POY15780.1 hypothetical protein C3476_24135 [Mycobacterium kansasii]POY23847.1 hypothetical protein C3469_21595 [Mycobacterium kansasii]
MPAGGAAAPADAAPGAAPIVMAAGSGKGAPTDPAAPAPEPVVLPGPPAPVAAALPQAPITAVLAGSSTPLPACAAGAAPGPAAQ